MKVSRVALMHDGWVENGVHYFAVYAVYMSKYTVIRQGTRFEEEKLLLPCFL